MPKSSKSKESLFKRLTRLFRGGPIVKRKVRSLDTVVAGPDKMTSSGVSLFQKSTSPTYANITANAYNLSERLMRYQDYQEMEYCVHGGQLIATPESPDGFIKIEDLAMMCIADPNKTFIVYSYDHEKKMIVPALAKQARQTRVDHAWRVKFDNGKEIIASDNHRLMLRDASYREIKDLQVGDAMMPFCRKDLFENAEKGTKGYHWIHTMDKRFCGWTKEHQLVAEWILQRDLQSNEVVHHVNFVKTDNRPENLRVMTDSDHAALNNNVKWAPDSEWIEKFKVNHSTWMRNHAPTMRRDVTFARILEVSETQDFNMSAVARVLDVDLNVIYSRLAECGFKDYGTFVNAYRVGEPMICNSRHTGVNDLTIEMITSMMDESDTKATLCMKLNCSVNVLNKFCDRVIQKSWSQLRLERGWKPNSQHGGRPKGSNKGNLTFKHICDAYVPNLTLPRLAEKLGVNKNTIISCLAQNGFKKYSEFSSTYQNCKVISVEYVGVIPLFDLTVDGYKNFATDSVISHNTPELAAALDIYSEEVMAQDDKGRVLHIYSDNPKIKPILDDLFYNVLNIEFNGRSWVRNLCKYGDFCLYNDVSPEYGIVNAFPIPINEIEREEGFDRDDPFAVRFRWLTLGNRVLEDWEVSHFRLLGNDMFLPYGASVIEPARRIWRQLILIEDAMLVYRIVRAPDRRVFYVDIGNMPNADVPAYLEEQRKSLRTQPVVEGSSGRIDLRFNPMSVDEDFIIGVRGADSGTKIEPLPGGANTAAVEDVEYIQKKLFAAIKIPRAYLGYEEMLSCLPDDAAIPLMNGTQRTIGQLARECESNEATFSGKYHVYSCDPATGEVRPGRLIKAWKTRSTDTLYEVVLDTGAKVRCTGNHPFMCRDGSYVRADELVVGQSLMSLYEKFSTQPVGEHDHKITAVSVLTLDAPIDVYDVEVEKWHNFAIATGENDCVFVHNSKSTLAQEDIRFSRAINVIQKTVIAELNKLAIIHLFAHGFDGDDLINFNLRLSNPSTIAQQQKLELWRARFDIAGSMPENMLTREFVQQEIFGLNDDQIRHIDERRMYEAAIDAAIGASAEGGGGGGGSGGGADLFGSGGGGADLGGSEPDVGGEAGADLGGPAGGAEAGGGEEEAGGEELEAGDEPGEEDDEPLQLLVSADDASSPVNVSRHSKRARDYTAARRRSYRGEHGGIGQEYGGNAPDFNQMLSLATAGKKAKSARKDRSSTLDPFGSDDMRQLVTGKLESVSRGASNENAVGLPADVLSSLSRMAARFNSKSQSGVILESSTLERDDAVFIDDSEDDR